MVVSPGGDCPSLAGCIFLAERERLGREIHDGTGQQWSYVNMQVEAACLLLTEEKSARAQEILTRLGEVVRGFHADIRESITGLRTKLPEGKSLWKPLEEYIETFRRNHDIDVEVAIDKDFPPELLAPTVRVQLLRIVQEALTNIRKHAQARHVKVAVLRREETVEIRVEDDGRGFEPPKALETQGCYGIGIMKERAGEIGARLIVDSTPRAGTAVVLVVPLRAARRKGRDAGHFQK